MAERILIVDDDPTVRSLIAEILELEGYEVETACDGAEAVEAVKRRPPATILLDMQMPIMDGWGVASALRQLGLGVPTLVMTTAVNARERAAEIAAAGYLAKPFDLDDLLAAVERVQRE